MKKRIWLKKQTVGIFALLLIGLLQFSPLSVAAQTNKGIKVSGTVSDNATRETIPGTSIVVKGTQNGLVSDMDGKYSINVPVGATLVFSCVGYETQEIKIVNQQKIDVAMQSSVQAINDVVVVGYGKTTKKEVTGSISSLKSDEFNRGVYNDPMGLVQGKIAGLTVLNSNGADPLAGYTIMLRGTNTLTSGQGPLIVIDGVAGGDLKNISPEEVVSMDVLKDGSAAAIYGTRGSNGVIIITTKRAKKGESKVEYSGQFSIQALPRGVDNLNATEFAQAITQYAPDKKPSIYGANTNWFNEVTRQMPFSHRQNVAVSGGTENFSHRTTIFVDNADGLLKNNTSKKYLFRTNMQQKVLGDLLLLDYSLSIGIRKYKPANYDIFTQAFIQNPTQPIFDPNNTMYGGYSSLPGILYYNPVAMLNERDQNGKTITISPNLRAKLKLYNGLYFNNFISYEASNYQETSYKTRYYPASVGSGGEAEIDNGSSFNIQYESTLDYSHSFNKHSIQAVVGYSYQQAGQNSSSMINTDFDFDLYGADNIAAGAGLQVGKGTMNSYRETNKLISFFGRVMYNYDNKYLASVSLRREGSSKFGENHKWGYFPAVSLGWRINQEDFLKDKTWIKDLKLRIGYGETGNQEFSNYKSLLLMGKAGKFLYNGNWINTYQPISNPNPELRWEKKQEINVGVDFAFLNNRVSGSLDLYSRKSTDLLYTYNVSVPPYIFNQLFTNVGTISNNGVEFTLNVVPVKTKDFDWTTIFTFSKNTNKLIKFSSEEFKATYLDVAWMGVNIPQFSQRIEEGKSLGTFYGPVWLGIDKYGNDKFKNQDATGVVNAKDYEAIGNAYPFCTLGWSNAFTYKNWNLNFALRSNIGGDVLNYYRAYYENWQTIGARNIVRSQLDEPKFKGTPTYSSKYIEKGTFIKVDNLSLGYRLKIKSQYLSDVRFSLTAQDLLLITKYKGVDPEVNLSGLEPGLEKMNYYPRTTSFIFGVNVTF